MLNSLDERLDRIEAALASNAEMLGELLKRKRAPAQKRQSKAQVHDDAVKGAKVPQALQNAWNAFCVMRMDKGALLTANAVDLLLTKLSKHSDSVAIEALNTSIIKGYTDVYPKAQEGGAVMGGDWFSKEDTNG